MLCSQPLVFILFDELKCQKVKLRYHSDSVPNLRPFQQLSWEPLG